MKTNIVKIIALATALGLAAISSAQAQPNAYYGGGYKHCYYSNGYKHCYYNNRYNNRYNHKYDYYYGPGGHGMKEGCYYNNYTHQHECHSVCRGGYC